MRDAGTQFEPYGTTVFCEDIRFESSGSVSLIGVYLRDLEVGKLPIIIPKFSIHTTVIVPPIIGQAPDVKLYIFLPGDKDEPSIVLDEKVADGVNVEHSAKRDKDVPPHTKIVQQVVISPFQIEEEGIIKVRTRIGSDYIKAGILRVSLTKSEE